MQIHVTDPSPAKCATFLWQNPVRARKMITETQQMLACAQVHFGYANRIRTIEGKPYKTPKHIMNHPCTKWVCYSRANAYWTVRYLIQLLERYKGKKFKNVLDNTIILTFQFLTSNDPEAFLNLAKSKEKNLDFTDEPNVFKAYKLYLQAQEGLL